MFATLNGQRDGQTVDDAERDGDPVLAWNQKLSRLDTVPSSSKMVSEGGLQKLDPKYSTTGLPKRTPSISMGLDVVGQKCCHQAGIFEGIVDWMRPSAAPYEKHLSALLTPGSVKLGYTLGFK